MDDQNTSIIHNLEDAGCDNELVEQFFRLGEAGNVDSQFRLLSKHRSVLLDIIHDNQKKLDCLDYLIYKIRRAVFQSKS